MANYDPDKEMFDIVKGKIKDLTDALTQWQQKETAIHSLAEVHAKNSGAPPEAMDAHVYMHKKALKKAMADQAKESEQGQGVPSAQNMPGGPTSQVVPGPQGSQGQGGPGNMVARNTPVLPMAGQAKNTGANGWEGLVKPTPYPGQAQTQTGAPTQSNGPITGAQRPMPGMPTPGTPGGFTGPGTMRPLPLTNPTR